jgi:uncharacterized protein YjbI with pentapeptide repeats
MSRTTRVLTALVVGLLLVLGFDGITYAATGSSLLLGKVNKAGAVTTVQNTGSGAALNLVTRTSAYPPFTTNGAGLVKNLYAARAANANTVGGLTPTQLRSGIDAATVGGKTIAQVRRTCSEADSAPGANFAGCYFAGTTITAITDLTGANFAGATLHGEYMSGVILNAANFQGATVELGTNLGQASLRFADFRGAVINDISLGGSMDLTGTDFSNAAFNGTFLSDPSTTLAKAHFAGATYVNVTCPDSTLSTAHGDTCVGHGVNP